jgi:hypothetical protein
VRTLDFESSASAIPPLRLILSDRGRFLNRLLIMEPSYHTSAYSAGKPILASKNLGRFVPVAKAALEEIPP